MTKKILDYQILSLNSSSISKLCSLVMMCNRTRCRESAALYLTAVETHPMKALVHTRLWRSMTLHVRGAVHRHLPQIVAAPSLGQSATHQYTYISDSALVVWWYQHIIDQCSASTLPEPIMQRELLTICYAKPVTATTAELMSQLFRRRRSYY